MTEPESPHGLHRNAGFTLLELVLVLVILALGSMVVLPNFSDMSARSFNAQVREASALLNYARRMAVVTGQPATVKFVAAVEEDFATAVDVVARSRINEGAIWSSPGIAVEYRDSTGQRSETENPIEITFFPEGGSSGGELTFRQSQRSIIISIDPFSGRVRSGSADG